MSTPDYDETMAEWMASHYPTDLLGNPISIPRGKHNVEPRGYAGRPGDGPADETCGTCKYKVRREGCSGRYLKCQLTRAAWTGGRRTDILARSPACEKWEAKDGE